MFKFLRRMILPIIMIALTGFLATIVFQWGMDITSRRDYVSANTAATINGEEVTWTQFNSVYDRFYQAEMQNADEDLSEFRKKELRTLAWQQVLHDRLLMQEVGKYQIKVSDDELYAFLRFQPPPDLQQMTYFQTDGVFDYQKYRAAMADPSVSSFWASVEPMVRIEILKQKVQATIIQTAQVTNEEIRNAYLADKEKVKVGMVNVPFSRFTPAPEGSDEDLQSYFQQHSDDYKVEERAILNVVMISKEATDYDWEIDSAQAVLIYDSLKAGGDFAELASYHSDDISAQSGGDLGWFSEGQMVGEFDEKVFSMSEGEVSEPVRTQFGWHIIKVHEFREDKDKGKEVHASHILFKVSASAETLDRSNRRLEEFRTAAEEFGFAQSTQDFELEMLTTSPFEKNVVIDHLGYDTDASEFAFTNEVGAVSPVYENRNSFYIIELAQKLPAGMAAFDEIKDQVKADYDVFVTENLCRDTANAIHTEITSGATIGNAAGKFSAKYETPDEFSRNSSIRGLGRAPEVIGAAFSLTEVGQITKPIDYARGTVILQLIERTTTDDTDFSAKRDSVYQSILGIKQQELYGRWFDHLVETSEIVNHIEGAFQETNY